MLNRIVICTVSLFLIFSSAIAGERNQIPPGKWSHNPHVRGELELTDEERTRLDKMFYEHRRNMIKLKSSIDNEQLEFSEQLEKKVLDERAVLKQFKTLESARSALAEERFMFLLQIRKALGFERFQKLKMFFQEHRQSKAKRFGNIKRLKNSGGKKSKRK